MRLKTIISILDAIDDDTNLSVLKIKTGLTYSLISEFISNMAMKGIVSKQRFGRVCRVSLTQEGKDVLNVLKKYNLNITRLEFKRLKNICVKSLFKATHLGYNLINKLLKNNIIHKVGYGYYSIHDREFFNTYVKTIDKYLSDVI